MTNTSLEKKEKFHPSNLDYGAIRLAQSTKDVTELGGLLELEYDLILSRVEVRQLLNYAHQQKLSDEVAYAPNTVDPLSKKIDAALNLTIDILMAENEVLVQISEMPAGEEYEIHDTGEVTTPADAKKTYMSNVQRLMDIKKSLIEQQKSEKQNTTNVNVDIGVDFGTMVSEAVQRCKDVDMEVLG